MQTFENCKSLSSIHIHSNIQKIKFAAFKNCTSLQNITFDKNCRTEIGHYTFAGCSSIKKITIPSGITGLGFKAFSGCNNLSEVKLLMYRLEELVDNEDEYYFDSDDEKKRFDKQARFTVKNEEIKLQLIQEGTEEKHIMVDPDARYEDEWR
ncbi:leucine-rich repeat domain-containing protein [Treponema sp. OMZ 788]|uniref:leucine-rich repeat domain-containing protein n=1 Tax=Treponema sp. OMZ 788 TaxID=2563664 RepID=UPI0020A5938C|nr:leucine-rich repeat domain-containing protein [Treponema sp. OMZ 788]